MEKAKKVPKNEQKNQHDERMNESRTEVGAGHHSTEGTS